MPTSRLNRGLPIGALVTALLLSAAMVPGIPAAAASRNSQPHDFQTVGCTHCHITVPGQSVMINKRVFRRDISELCLECHEDSKENQINHRIGIIPSMKVPDDLHLGARGEMTCITCHMPHLPAVDKKTGARSYFLRRSMLKRELCLACHYEEKFDEPTSAFRILAPMDSTILKTMPVPFIGMVSDDLVKEVTLFINGLPVRLTVKNKAFSTLLTLQEGINNLKLEAKRARTTTMTLLYNPNLAEEVTYKLYYSHGILKKSDCKICHAEEDTTAINISDEVLCSKCHESKKTLKYLHGPVAAGSCTVCHDPHGQTNRYFLVSQGEKLCLTCHAEKEILLHFIDKSSANTEFLKSKGCGFCHDPHQSDKKFLLRKS